MSSAPLIYAKIAAVMADVGAVGKNQKNSFQNYAFRGIDDVLSAVQPALVKHGVFLVPDVRDRETNPRTTNNGKAEIHTILRVDWTAFAEDGSNVRFSTVGEASDTGDKSCNKAMTAAQKYALVQLLSIPTYESGRDTEERSPAFVPAEASKPAPDTSGLLTAEALVAKIADVKAAQHLKNLKEKYGDTIRAMIDADRTRVISAYNDAAKRLGVK